MKKAVILFNLGGPDKLESVEPFLFNLFNDPEILSIPSIFRYPLAKFISKSRTPITKNIYKEVIVSHDDIIENVQLMPLISDEKENGIFVDWLPFFNDMDLIVMCS